MKSIKTQLLLSFAVVSLVSMTLLGVASYVYSSRALVKEAEAYTKTIMEVTSGHLAVYFGQIKSLLQVAAADDGLIDGLMHYDAEDYARRLQMQRTYEELFRKILQFHPYIKDFIVVDDSGRPIFATGNAVRGEYDFDDALWFPDYGTGGVGVRFSAGNSQSYYLNPDAGSGDVITAVAPVYDYLALNRQRLGYVICNFRTDVVSAIVRRFSVEKSGSLHILDEWGNSVSRHSGRLPFSGKLPDAAGGGEEPRAVVDDDRLIVYSTLEHTGWTAVAVLPWSEIVSRLGGSRLFYIGLVVFSFVLFAAFAVYATARISRPVIRLQRRMQRVGDGLNVKLKDTSYLEIAELTGQIDRMVERIHELNRNVMDARLTSKDRTIQALQAQINPHFIFNTLQSIKAIALVGDRQEVGRIVTLLGRMMRYSAYQPDELVTLGRELDHIGWYMEILDFRYPGRFRIEIDVPEPLRCLPMLKLTLQPLVENAVAHGLGERERGTVSIAGEVRPDGAVVTVADDGSGISDERLQELRESFERPDEAPSPAGGGVGLRNVHDRIRLKFGRPYGLSIGRGPAGGCEVRISIPGPRGGDRS